MRLFLSERSFRRAAAAAAPADDVAWIVKLYQANPDLRRRALAAYWGVDVAAIARRSVSDQDTLLAPFGRVIAAIADGLAELRGGDAGPPMNAQRSPPASPRPALDWPAPPRRRPFRGLSC